MRIRRAFYILLYCFPLLAICDERDEVRVLDKTEAEAIAVALGSDIAKSCKHQCFVLVSSNEKYCQVTFSKRDRLSEIGTDAYQYRDGMTLLINRNTLKIEEIYRSR